MNNNKTRGISGLSILLCVLVLAGVYWFMSQSGVQQTAYTYQDFQKDLKKEKVESVEVKQNKVAPTGTLKIRLKNDDIEQLHVSDVNSAEDLLESYDISYSVDNVPQDSWMKSSVRSGSGWKSWTNGLRSLNQQKELITIPNILSGMQFRIWNSM